MHRKVRWGVLLLAALLTLLLSPAAAGASALILYRFDGTATFDNLGASVAGAGDVNGDGVGDFIVGSPFADPGGRMNAGSASVYSGANGAALLSFDGPTAGDQLGRGVSGVGDVNGDGRADVAVGSPGAKPAGRFNAGRVYMFSGANGVLLQQFDGTAAGEQLGWSVAGTGDVDGDLIGDVLAGAPGALARAGSALVFSGFNGTQVYRFNGESSLSTMGWSVAGVGDVNNDGRADMMVGAPGALTCRGSAFVFSGYDGALLYRFNGTSFCDINLGTNGDRLGTSVAGVGDVNGDRRPDLVVGAPLADPSGLSDAGSAHLFSGANGGMLVRLDGLTMGDQMGTSVAGAGDVDGNGRPDLVVGAPNADPNLVSAAGSVYVFSGTNGGMLVSFEGTTMGDQLGRSVGGPWNVNGNGRASLMAGAPGADPNSMESAGSAFVFTPGQVNNPLPDTIEELLEWAYAEVDSGDLFGAGPSNMAAYRLRALMNMLEAVQNHLATGQTAGACQQLAQTLTRTDGQASPPDFADGPAAPQLAAGIQNLQATLAC